MRRWFTAALSVALFVLFSTSSVYAASAYDGDFTYRVNQDGSAVVSQQYTITSGSNVKKIQAVAPFAEITKIKASSSAGGKVTAKSTTKQIDINNQTYTYNEVVLTLANPISTSSVATVKLEYTVEQVVQEFAALKSIYIPKIEGIEKLSSRQVTVLTPLEFGVANILGANTTSRGISSGRQSFVFDNKKLNSGPIALSFGESIDYETTINLNLRNDSFLPRLVNATLPPDLHNQRVYLESISPNPRSISFDKDGNIIAQYFLWPKQEKEVQAKLIIQANHMRYSLENYNAETDAAPIDETYIQSTKYWPLSGSVSEWSQSYAKFGDDDVKNIKAIFSGVVQDLSLDPASNSFDDRQSADKVIGTEDPVGQLAYVDLLTAGLRSQGIPARVVVGYLTNSIEGIKVDATTQGASHVWVEAYVQGVGWIGLDPVYEEKYQGYGQFTPDKIGLYVWGENDFQPTASWTSSSSVDYLPKLNLKPLEGEFPEASSSEPSLSSKKYVVLPGLSITRATASMPAGFAVDNQTITIDGQVRPLGSLTPLQQKTVLSLSLLGNSFQPSQVAYGPEGEAVLEDEAEVSYLLLVIIITLILAAVGLWVWMKRKGLATKTHTFFEEDLGEDIEQQDLLGGDKPKDSKPEPKTSEEDEQIKKAASKPQQPESKPEPKPEPESKKTIPRPQAPTKKRMSIDIKHDSQDVVNKISEKLTPKPKSTKIEVSEDGLAPQIKRDIERHFEDVRPLNPKNKSK